MLRKKSSWALILACVVAAGVGGFLIGHSGTGRAATNVGARYAAGYGHYQAGFQAGFAAGQQSGQQTGEQRGYTRGVDVMLARANGIVRQVVNSSFAAGARAVFAGFSSPWTRGAYYIVKVDAGSGGAP